MKKKQTIQLFVLGKHNFNDSSVIFSGLSHEFGLIKFIVKGDRSVNKKRLPKVDLLRNLAMSFHFKENSELQKSEEIEVIHDFSKIASNYKLFTAVLWICRFLDINLHPSHPVPEIYDLFHQLLKRIESGEKFDGFNLIVGFVLFFFIQEGFLPATYVTENEPNLLPFYQKTVTDVETPTLSTEEKTAMTTWLTQIVHLQHHKMIKIPTTLK